MHNQDLFRYRSKAEIDSSLPDLHGVTKWAVAKIVKVRTSNLRLIAQAKDKFQIRLDTVWLAESYFQRYFSQYAFQSNTPVIFVAACIHLACKASDLPRPLESVIKKTFQMRYANDPKEIGKIDDFMFYTEVKERVLLAERALLYCFNFDFKTSDPYSYALKYNNTYKLLEGDDSQRAFAWLNIAALATTLCLQYPASLLGVVAVWYAQHLVLGEIPIDEKGLEWWEKLPTDKQGSLPVSKVTAEQIEDAHWQLVPHANWTAERDRLQKAAEEAQEKGEEAKGRLPGEGCHCKVCSLHYDLVKQAKQAEAQGQTSPQGASDASATTAAGINLPTALTMEAPGPTSAVTKAEDEPGAAASPAETMGVNNLSNPGSKQYSPAAGVMEASHTQRRSSPSWYGHQSPSGKLKEGLGQRPSSSPAEGHSRHQPLPNQLRERPATAAAAATPSWQQSAPQLSTTQAEQRAQQHEQQHAQQHAQHSSLPQGQAYSPVVYPDQSSPSQHAYQQHQHQKQQHHAQQHQQQEHPQHQQHQHHRQQANGLSRFGGEQNDYAHAVGAVDDDSGPEEGEIEEGEVLPDGTVAEAQGGDGVARDVRHAPLHDDSTAKDSVAEGLHMNGHAPLHDDSTAKDSVAGRLHTNEHAPQNKDSTAKAVQHGDGHDATWQQEGSGPGPGVYASAKKRKQSGSPEVDPADEAPDPSRKRSCFGGSPVAASNVMKRQRSNSPCGGNPPEASGGSPVTVSK